MKDNYLITGGAGFIGSNLADHYLSNNKRVTIFDNFSREGSEENVRWLQQRYGNRLTVVYGDVRWDSEHLRELVEKAEVVFPNLKRTNKQISIRLPEPLIAEAKEKAEKLDVPYQKLMREVLQHGVVPTLLEHSRCARLLFLTLWGYSPPLFTTATF